MLRYTVKFHNITNMLQDDTRYGDLTSKIEYMKNRVLKRYWFLREWSYWEKPHFRAIFGINMAQKTLYFA